MKGTKRVSETLLSVSCAVLPENGEDSFALGQDERMAWLCVADGCGGLGSRRYPQFQEHTGAYLASRIASQHFSAWAAKNMSMPATPEDGSQLCRALERELHGALIRFANEHLPEEKSRIVGSMQRRLPTTFCAAAVQEGAAGWRETCFLWAGDSRGYVLDEEGLHQCTQDHLRGESDAFETLYRDLPLSRLLCADQPLQLSMRRMRAPLPCVILTATDGAFSSLRTPMEFEMLLLQTLLSARSWMSWQKKLAHQLKKIAQDDATILLMPCGAEDFESFKKRFILRRAALQEEFITPVRRRRGDVEYARQKWRIYRENYDWTGGGRHARMDWRI